MHAENATNTELETDLLFDLLSSPRRRTVLQVLNDEGDTITELRELSDHVAARENDKPIPALTRQERKRVYVSIYQTHAPKLAEAGAISFDPETGAIALTDRFQRFAPYLGWETPPPVAAHTYYLVLAGLSALFYAAVSFDVWLFAAIPTFVAGILVVLAFAVLALVLAVAIPDTTLDLPPDYPHEP